MTEPRPTWPEVWMTLAVTIGTRSRCTRGKIGCILVAADNQVVSASYVGPPPNFRPAMYPDNESDCRSWCPRSQPGHEPVDGYSDCNSSHAEMNSVARADFSRLKGGQAYVNGAVCFSCAKLLAAAGLAGVTMIVNESDAHRKPERSIKFLQDSGLFVRTLVA